FQRATALKVARLVKTLQPGVRIVVGGYDPTLAPDAYQRCPDIDFIVRGEGEETFSDLLRALEHRTSPADVPGLSYRDGAAFVQNRPRPIANLSGNAIRLPNRDSRVLAGYTFMGRPV